MSRPYIEVAMEVEEEKLFLLVVESSPGDIQQRSYDQRGKPRPIIGGLRYYDDPALSPANLFPRPYMLYCIKQCHIPNFSS